MNEARLQRAYLCSVLHWSFARNTVCETKLKVRLHAPSTSLFFVPFKNGFSAVLLCCLHSISKISKVPVIKGGIDEALIQKWKKLVSNLANLLIPYLYLAGEGGEARGNGSDLCGVPAKLNLPETRPNL